MTKHKKLLGVVISVLLVSLILIPKIVVKAAQNPNPAATTAPTTCTKDDEKQLINYYQISYDWNSNGTALEVKAAHGKFRFVQIDTNFFTNSFSKDSDGFYVIDGQKGVVGGSNKVKLKIRDSARGSSATVKLALSEHSAPCDSLIEYNQKKAAGQTTHTFDTGQFEIIIPYSSKDQSKFKQSNPRYNDVCIALREGKNYQGKINSEILKLYDSSTNAKSYYSIIAPSCFQTSAVYVYGQARIVKIIETALSTWPTYNTLKNHSSIGTGSTDVTGAAWLINFDNVKSKAIAENHQYYADGKGNFRENNASGKLVKKTEEAFSLKCKVTANSSTDFSNLLEYKADGNYNIDANTQNFYAYDESKQSVTYKWYTHWGGKKDDGSYKKTNPSPKIEVVKNFCTKKCEEAVEVKYGPPVASKAGLCFEYQVQVTSRVKCTTSMEGNPPTPNLPFCVPVPYCNDIPGHTHQAGASDEYKSCVQSCDGGKYTEECSEKCYSEVYEGVDSNKTGSNAATAQTQKLYSRTYSYSGYHYFEGSKIRWAGKGYSNYYSYFEKGRTYRDHLTHGGHYVPESGFKKRLYDTGTCKDPCKFKGCSRSSDYVNKIDFRDDYMDNLAAYKTAINACKASASCTTKTATFTISADYINSKSVVKTVDYPYTRENEKLQSDEDKDNCKSNDSEVASEDNIILNYAGCYKNCGNGLQYHTRWSFPGAWLDKKTGSLSFQIPDNTDGWTQYKDKFCVPLDAKDVNTKWWNYYYKYYDANHTTSLDDESVQTYCKSISTTGSSTISETDIEKWNINAATRMFGYYGWSFDISCFYALNSKPVTSVSGSEAYNEKCYTPTSTEGTSYRIRTVDLKNLFPATGSGSSSSSSANGTRTPGFNWSKHADVLASNGKNSEYQSTPSIYAEKVQSMGYNVYNESNVDYEFVLTKEILKSLKSGSRNYSDFKGDMVTQHGMYSYRSSLIRSGTFSGGDNKVLKEQAIGCNNVENYNSSSCSDIHKEGE